MLKKVYIPLLVALFTIVSTFVAHVSMADGLLFLLSQAFLVFLPGILLYRVSGLNYKDTASSFFASYLFGYGLTTVIYIICLMFGYQRYVICPIIIISIAALFFIYKDRKKLCFEWEEKKEMLFIAGVLCISYVMGLLGYTCNNLSPEVNGYAYQNQDYLFWMRNCVACSMSYPVHDLSILGKNIYYHYFSNMHIAFLHVVAGIGFFDLCFVYTRIIITLLTVGGAYLLVEEVFKDGYLRMLAVVAILFTTGFEPITFISYIQHIYVGSFGLAEGLGYALFTTAIFVCILKNTGLNRKLLFTFIFAFALTIGLKAPLGLVILAGIGVTCFYTLFNKKTFSKSIVLGISSLLIFVVIYYLFIMAHGNTNVNDSSRFPLFDFVTTALSSGFERKILCLIQAFISNKYVVALLVLFFYVLMVAFMPITYIIIIWKNGCKTKASPMIIFLITIGVVGFLLTTFFSHTGMSQIYYWFIGYPCSVIGLLFIIEDKALFAEQKVRKAIYVVTSIGLLGMCSIMFSPVRSAMLCLCGINPKVIVNDGFSQTGEEMQAMRWLRENTHSDAIVVSNKVLAEHGFRSFIVSAFAERQVFLEGYDYSSVPETIKNKRLKMINSAFNGSEDAVAKLKHEGVKYLIVFKSLDNNTLPSSANDIVFDNNSVRIVAI